MIKYPIPKIYNLKNIYNFKASSFSFTLAGQVQLCSRYWEDFRGNPVILTESAGNLSDFTTNKGLLHLALPYTDKICFFLS